MKIFIDTNVLVYWVDDSSRADEVEQWLAADSVISVQVLNEFANVLMKKRALPLSDIQALSDTLVNTCEVFDLSVLSHQTALELIGRYRFSLSDANIIAAAGISGCSILYSEDMQNGLNIKLPDFAGGALLSIQNPFKKGL